jgi:hypothetical protein
MNKEILFQHILEMDSGCVSGHTPENVLGVQSTFDVPGANKKTSGIIYAKQIKEKKMNKTEIFNKILKESNWKEILDRAGNNKDVSLSEFEEVSKRLRSLRTQLDDIEDESTFESFWPWAEESFGVTNTEIFDAAPSADWFHYRSNARPDQGEANEFLEESDYILDGIEEWIKDHK